MGTISDALRTGGAFAVSEDVAEACAGAWDALGSPGEWWTGAERGGIAAEARRARDCATCAKRKTALSPGRGTGGHRPSGLLGVVMVDAVHRIATDPGRLTSAVLADVVSSGNPEAAFVEAVGVIFTQTLVDSLAIALGAPLPRLPDPRPGEPPRVIPEGAGPGGAWVPVLLPDYWTGELAEMYARGPGGSVANIILALSVVPPEQLNLITLMRRTYRHPEPLLEEPQIQLIASTVSAYNDCFY